MNIILSSLFIATFLQALLCEYTPRTNSFVCTLQYGMYYSQSTNRCEFNEDGIDLTNANKCADDYAEYTDGGGITRCRSVISYKIKNCLYQKANILTGSLVCEQCREGFSLIEGICMTKPDTLGCKKYVYSSTLPDVPACDTYYSKDSSGKCQICLTLSADKCTNVSPACGQPNPKCLACSEGYTPHPDGIGCMICPSGCANCTVTINSSDNTTSYTCNSCLKGFYIDQKDGTNKCYSCERTFGIRCNQCTKQKCTECKDLYYLSSDDKCLACPDGTNCNLSGTTIVTVGCTLEKRSLVTTNGVTYCIIIDENAVALNSNFESTACKDGFEIQNNKCVFKAIANTCGPSCEVCDETLIPPMCTKCLPTSPFIHDGKCIECEPPAEIKKPKDLFLFSPTQCYTSQANPNKDPNCFNEFGFGTDGICLVCLPGYKLNTTTKKCTPCITYTITSSAHVINYQCTTNQFTINIPITSDTATIPKDPLTQPEFYSSFLGIPITLLKNLQINILDPQLVDDSDNPSKNENSNNSGNGNNNQPGENNNKKNNTPNNNQNTSNNQNLQSDQNQQVSYHKINTFYYLIPIIFLLTLY